LNSIIKRTLITNFNLEKRVRPQESFLELRRERESTTDRRRIKRLISSIWSMYYC